MHDDNDVEYPDVETAVQQFHDELVHNGRTLEDPPNAANSDATEMEEDQHIP